MKYVVGAVLTLALVTPALAAEFYVVQEPTTKKCTVVSEKPTTEKTVIMGNGHVYTSRSEAQTALKEVCKTTSTSGSSTTTTTTTTR
jgi:hypothetical protein